MNAPSAAVLYIYNGLLFFSFSCSKQEAPASRQRKQRDELKAIHSSTGKHSGELTLWQTRKLELSSSGGAPPCKWYCTLVCPASPGWILVRTSPPHRALHQVGISYLLSSTAASTGRWTSQECSSQEAVPWNITDRKRNQTWNLHSGSFGCKWSLVRTWEHTSYENRSCCYGCLPAQTHTLQVQAARIITAISSPISIGSKSLYTYLCINTQVNTQRSVSHFLLLNWRLCSLINPIFILKFQILFALSGLKHFYGICSAKAPFGNSGVIS